MPKPIFPLRTDKNHKQYAKQSKEVWQYFDTRLSKHLYLTVWLLTQSDESYFPNLHCLALYGERQG